MEDSFVLPTGGPAEISPPRPVELYLGEFKEGWHTGDEGLSWFQPGDPFTNVLSLMVSRCGDDWSGTVFYAGLPCMVVLAGGSRDEASQFEAGMPEYLESEVQHVHAMFFEHVLGSLPAEGDEDEIWPFDHDAMNMVFEINPETGSNYNLYHDLMGEAGGEGHEYVAFIGCVARSMCAALKGADPEFAEGGSAHAALRGF